MTEKQTEKLALVGVIDYFRTLKALIIFFMNNAPNQNGKVLEETLAGSNSDAVGSTLFRINFPFFASL